MKKPESKVTEVEHEPLIAVQGNLFQIVEEEIEALQKLNPSASRDNQTDFVVSIASALRAEIIETALQRADVGAQLTDYSKPLHQAVSMTFTFSPPRERVPAGLVAMQWQKMRHEIEAAFIPVEGGYELTQPFQFDFIKPLMTIYGDQIDFKILEKTEHGAQRVFIDNESAAMLFELVGIARNELALTH